MSRLAKLFVLAGLGCGVVAISIPDASAQQIAAHDPTKVSQRLGLGRPALWEPGATAGAHEARLAYRVLKFSEGQYILLQFSAKPETVKEIERRLRVNDLVIKFLTVRIDEKLKRIEKRRKAREKRAARKPVTPPSAPVLASPLMPAPPAAPVPGAPSTPEEAGPENAE